MPRRPKQRGRRRVAGPALTAAVIAVSIGSLGGLHLWAGEADGVPGHADALGLALLRANLERNPGDSSLRLRLTREQLALGMYRDAERTLVPLFGAGSAMGLEAALLSVDVAMAAWRAVAPGLPGRRAAETSALARLEAFLPRQGNLDDLAHAARAARELGRPDLAARADERAAALEPDPRRAMDLGLIAVDEFRAADRGDEALRLAEKLVERFPAERTVVERALAIALSQNDPRRARRLGERLISIGTVDPVSLGRQLDLELGAGDLAGALQTAERLAEVSPDDANSRLTAARVALWAGEPRRALLHWSWLAKRRGAPHDVDEALALARALRDEFAVADLLRTRARRMPLPAAALSELTHALESTAAPGIATTALERYASMRPADREAWEALASAQERKREFTAALGTRLEIARRFGASVANSVAAAKLHWALGRRGEALAELQAFVDSAPPDRSEYWEVLAEIAWQEEADPIALRAYQSLWESGHIDVAGTERLLMLARDSGRADDLIRIGRQGWSRMKQPRLLLLAMDEAARTGRWAQVERMAEEAAASGDDFASLPAYWMLRARADERAGRVPEAIGAYRRALAGDPKSKAARSGILWLLSGAHQRGTLSEYLANWADDAPNDPELSRAYVAGLEELRTARSPLLPPPVAAGVDIAAESLGNVVLGQQRAFVRSEIPGGELELRQGLLAAFPNDSGLRVPDAETRVLAQARLSGLAGQTEVTAGVSLRPDRNVLQAGVARTQRLASVGEARLEASLHEPADESLALRLEAVRTRVGGAIAVSEGAAYQRLALDWKRWSTRSGADVGKGGAANFEIGWRTQGPDAIIRLQGGYQRNWLNAGPLPAALAVFAPDASAVLPDELAALGIGAGLTGLPVGPLRLATDAWIGSIGPPFRPAFRIQTAVAVAPFKNGELAMSAFAANDSFGVGGNLGLSLSLTHRFGF
jgi:tetratricopeptide (TPR) repeat protein